MILLDDSASGELAKAAESAPTATGATSSLAADPRTQRFPRATGLRNLFGSSASPCLVCSCAHRGPPRA